MNSKVISVAFIAMLIGVGFYFGFLRNEARCYGMIDKQITSMSAILEKWQSTPPSGMTKLEVSELALAVAEAKGNALVIRISEYNNICDYYFESFTLQRK